jgi:probable F420-dependent oxidoreductase
MAVRKASSTGMAGNSGSERENPAGLHEPERKMTPSSTTIRPFRFGMSGSGWGPPIDPAGNPTNQRAYLHNEVTKAEAAGFSIMTFADHTSADMRPPLTTILSAAAASSTMRFGTMVLNNDFWNPLLLAREIATINLLTDGRFELGIGAGHAKPDYDNAGIKYDEPKVRVDRLAEALPLLRALMDGEKVSHDGIHYSMVDAITGLPDGVMPARVPLLIGGNGTRVLRLAGKYADSVGLTGLVRNLNFGHAHHANWTDAYLDDRIEIVRSAAGPRFADLELNALVQRVVETDDRERAATKYCDLVSSVGLSLPLEHALNSPFLMFGTIPELAAQILATRQRFGITYFTTRPDSFDAVTKVIAALPNELNHRTDQSSSGKIPT